MRRFAAGMFAAAALIVVPIRASACTCVVAPMTDRVRVADVVFVGTAGSVADDGAGGAITRFDVEVVFKGSLPATVTVTVTAQGGCSVPFTPGSRYAVFGLTEANSVTTNLCSGTTEDYAALEKQVRPVQRYSGSVRPAHVPAAVTAPVTAPVAAGILPVQPSRTAPALLALTLASVVGALLVRRRNA